MNAAPAALGPDGPHDRSVERYAFVVSRYVTYLCGADGAEPLIRRVLHAIAIADCEQMSAAEAGTVVRRAARAVALGELGAAARRPERRAKRLLALRWRCATTPGLLRKRNDGEVSARELEGLYRHINRCEPCAAMAGHCDYAEWHLMAGLAEVGQKPTNRADGANPHPRSPAVGVPLTAETSPPPRRVAAAAGPVAPSAHSVDAEPVARKGAPGTRRSPRSPLAVANRRRIAGATLVLLIILAVGLLARSGGGPHDAKPQRAHGGPATRPGPGPPPVAAPTAAPVHGLRGPFVVGGARFAVFRDPKQGWTGFLKANPGPGRKWVAVTVRVRNLSKARFDPRVLAYRVLAPSGAAFAPVPALGTGPAIRRAPRPLGIGGLVETRLGFRIPTVASRLRLRFNATPGRPPIVVSLGQ